MNVLLVLLCQALFFGFLFSPIGFFALLVHLVDKLKRLSNSRERLKWGAILAFVIALAALDFFAVWKFAAFLSTQ